MAISAAGQQKSFSDLQTEFGGSHPITMGEYASLRESGSGNTIDMDDFAGGEAPHWDSWPQTLGVDTPTGWGFESYSNASFAQVFASLGFNHDTSNNRVIQRAASGNSGSATSYVYAYHTYKHFSSLTLQAKCDYATSTSGFASATLENPASYSPASGTYANITTTSNSYSPTWQWSVTISSGSGNKSISSTTNPDWTLKAVHSIAGTKTSSGGAKSLYLNASRSSGGGGGGEFFCIHEDMLVQTSDGLKHISDVINHTQGIWSYNFETNEKELVDILKIEIQPHSNLYQINNFKLTDDHAIYRIDGTPVAVNPQNALEKYGIEAEQIQIGDQIISFDGDVITVNSIEVLSGEHKTYTILTKNNNFYADNMLVHSEI